MQIYTFHVVVVYIWHKTQLSTKKNRSKIFIIKKHFKRTHTQNASAYHINLLWVYLSLKSMAYMDELRLKCWFEESRKGALLIFKKTELRCPDESIGFVAMLKITTKFLTYKQLKITPEQHRWCVFKLCGFIYYTYKYLREKPVHYTYRFNINYDVQKFTTKFSQNSTSTILLELKSDHFNIN